MSIIALFALSLAGVAEGDTNPYSQHAALALRVAQTNTAAVPRHGLLELTLDLSATYDNPFDPNDIDVWTVFSANGNKPIRVNAFLDQPFASKLDGDREAIESTGPLVWRVRFAPETAGDWQYRVFARDRSGSVQTDPASFSVTESENRGMMRIAPPGSRYFSFEDGSSFFAVGENMCWPGSRGSFDYEDWLAALGKAGGNWIRLWMWSWNAALEWTGDGKAPARTDVYNGAGLYNLANAWKLDRIFDIAANNSVQVMLCLGTYGEFTTGGYFGEGQWNANPYNAANGGPCAKPEDFWTDANARKLYQRRLRYLAARYGWRTNLFAWEFWNEANAPAAWIAEMARFFKGTGEFTDTPADPFHHLVSTTYGNKDIWLTPEIDFTMTHHYGKGDVPDSAPVIYSDARGHETFTKPHLMAEFGIDWQKTDTPYDPSFKGVNLHNGLWSSACSGNAGGAMIWYWDGYVHPGNLYGQFTALRRFADQIPWKEGNWSQLRFDAPVSTIGDETFGDLTLTPTMKWGRCPTETFSIAPNAFPDAGALPSFLYSPSKSDLRTTPVFHVKLDRPSLFSVRVRGVSDSAKLRFLLDGNVAKEVTLSATPPKDPNEKPEYEKTDFRTEYGVYQAAFNKDYGIDIAKGLHDVKLEVTEGDWLEICNFTLSNYASSRLTNLHCYGMTNGGCAILWIHNPAHNWKEILDAKPIPPTAPAQTDAHGLKPGLYTIEWWNTTQGKPEKSETIDCSESGFRLEIPQIDSDIAARIIPR